MANEIQQVVFDFQGSDVYGFTFDGTYVTGLNNTASGSPDSMQTAMESIIGAGNIAVTDGADNLTFIFEFIGAYANTNVPEIVPDGGTVETLVQGGSSAGLVEMFV